MGLRSAINGKCKDCNYDPLDRGTWRQQVESCIFKDCSLWPYRPLSSGKKTHLSGETNEGRQGEG